jgi:putative sigma-54 modulation protein
MEIQVYGQNMDISPKLREYVERKVDRLDRYMTNIGEVRVDLAEEKASRAEDRQVAQLTMRSTRGTVLRAEERTSDIYASIDAVVNKMYRQIERYKGKRRRRGEDYDALADLATAVELEEEELEAGKIVRRKRFPIAPMSEEEAIEQLELLGHDFFVFYNAETAAVNVLYRRKDDDYGLLEPELA